MARYTSLAPSALKSNGDANHPRNVRKIEIRSPKVRPCVARRRAPSRCPAPMALAIRAVAPVERPVPVARIIKKTGRDRDRAARTCVEMRPPK